MQREVKKKGRVKSNGRQNKLNKNQPKKESRKPKNLKSLPWISRDANPNIFLTLNSGQALSGIYTTRHLKESSTKNNNQ